MDSLILILFLWIYSMTTRSATTRWVEEDIANAGVPPQDNQDPPKEQAPLGGQAMVNPPVMTKGDIKVTFLNLIKSWLLKLKY